MREEGKESDAEGEGAKGEDAEASEIVQRENGRRMTEETATYRTEARTEAASEAMKQSEIV